MYKLLLICALMAVVVAMSGAKVLNYYPGYGANTLYPGYNPYFNNFGLNNVLGNFGGVGLGYKGYYAY